MKRVERLRLRRGTAETDEEKGVPGSTQISGSWASVSSRASVIKCFRQVVSGDLLRQCGCTVVDNWDSGEEHGDGT